MISLLPEYGIGIELTRRSLRAVLAKTLLGKVRVIDDLEIDELENRSAAECGELYRAFLKRNSLESPWTVVAIPREAFVYRERKLPASVIAELRSVMAMQVDTLHPFGDEEIVWDSMAAKVSENKLAQHSPTPPDAQRAVTVSAVVARKAMIEALAEWFEARGIPVSQFAASPLLLRGIANAAATTDADSSGSPVAIAYGRDHSWELLGVSPSGATSTRVLDLEPTEESGSYRKLLGEIERVFADLRLAESAEAVLLIGGGTANAGLIDELKGTESLHVQVKELAPQALAEAAARASFHSARASVLNVLPENRRRFIPSMSLAPTYALAAIVLLLCLGVGVRGTVQDWLYGRRLQAEIRSLRPRITEIEAIRGRERQTYNQILRLAGIRNEARVPLEVLEDLTQALPKDAWLQGLQMDGTALTIAGSAASASGVLQAISQAKTMESPQFLSAISRSNTGEESFRIGAKLRVGMR